MRDKVFYSICFGFGLGVLPRSFVVIDFYLTILVGIIALALILFLALFSNYKWPASPHGLSGAGWGIVFSVFIFACSLGILRFNSADTKAPIIFESRVGEAISLSGIIVDEPRVRENNLQLVVEVQEGNDMTKVLVSTSFGQDFKYGDEVSLEGALKKPANFITDQGKEFDYINYLRKDGILYVMSYPRVDMISREHGNFLKRILFAVKGKFLEKMSFAIASPENLLMGGLILGERAAFSEELRTQFVNTGTIHIVALSGYNVTIIAEWLMKLLSFLASSFSIGAGMFAILLFVLMTGAGSTAVRAGVMAVLALVARATGRDYDVVRALILAGVVMIMVNPLILRHDVSFQLSFIATVAVIFFAPRVEKYFAWVPTRFELRDIVSVTTAVYIFVLPFILYKMGSLSLVALPANLLILPFIPFTMLFGFLTGFAGFVSYVLSVPFGYISYLLLHYELGVISFFAHFPLAALSIPNFPLVLTLATYACFTYKIFGENIKSFFTAD